MRASLAFLLTVSIAAMQADCVAAPPIDLLQRLQSAGQKFLASHDHVRAKKVAALMIAECEVGDKASDDRFQVDDPQRIGFLRSAAKLDEAVGNHDRALATCRTIVTDGKPSTDRIVAQAIAVSILNRRKQESIEDAIQLFAQSSKLDDANKALRNDCQDLVFDAVVQAHESSKSSLQQIDQSLLKIEQELVSRDVPVRLARLTQFARAVYARNRSDDALLEETIERLANVIVDQQVTDYRRAQYWNLIAVLEERRRHFAAAFDACRKFEAHAAQAKRRDLEVIARDQTALITLRIGDYAEARTALESTQAAHAGELPPGIGEKARFNRLRNDIDWKVNLAKAMEGSHEFLPARSLLSDASKSLKEATASLAAFADQLQPLSAMVDNNLGLNHYLTGDFEKAGQLIGGADAMLTKIGASRDRIAEAKVNSAWIALAKGDTNAAAEDFATAVKLFDQVLGKDHSRYSEALTYQARVDALQDKKVQARQRIEQAEELVYRRICRDLAATEATRDRIALVQEARVHPESIAWPGTVDTYLELAPKLEISPQRQYQVVLRWKGLVQRFDRLVSDADAGSKEQERQITSKLRKAYGQKPSILKLAAWRKEIAGYESELRNLRRARQSRQAADATPEPTVEDVSNNLLSTDLFLDLFQIRTFRPPSQQGLVGSGHEYIAFAVRPGRAVTRIPLGAAEELDAAVVSWGNAIVSRNKNQADIAAKNVAAMAQQPILPALNENQDTDRLLIRPDGATHLIPWAALPGTDDKQYWIENLRFQVCNNIPSVDLPVAAIRPQSLLVVGGVDFGKLVKKYPPLEGSLREKDDVERLFRDQFSGGDVVELQAQAASESAVLEAMPGKNYVHLATHGFYHRDNEMDVFGVTGATTLLQTGLVVAGSGERGASHDQYLTAAEIREADLSGTALVMLSACKSGLGKPRAGQGVQGMLGSFHAAGVSHVVGTLWEIDDEATVTMVKRFYHHLWRKQLPAVDALRAAQLDMIHMSSDQPHADLMSDPYAWAAFVCSAK